MHARGKEAEAKEKARASRAKLDATPPITVDATLAPSSSSPSPEVTNRLMLNESR